MPVFALTIFVGAFLLFQVQPLIGKYILPWFGGGPGVWTTCMLFFQVVLLAGYAYSHFLSHYLRTRSQAIVHGLLLLGAVACLPIVPADRWKPLGTENPTWRILAVLAVSLGLPYFVLSTTGPLLQQWFSRTRPGASPYRLYALSNIGSLLALLSYPSYFESHFTRKVQASAWGWGMVLYALCCALCAAKLLRSRNVNNEGRGVEISNVPSPASPRPQVISLILWIALPACASLLLLATTNKMCQDVAVIPFLWVLPLALYLLSFIICFDNPRWYARLPFTALMIAALSAVCWVLFQGTDASIYAQIGIYCVALFVFCMVCHGELYRLRPEAGRLTLFYLLIAAGGALGGTFAAVVAPRIFHDYYELHWGLFLCALLFFFVCLAAGQSHVATQSRAASLLESWQAISWVLLLAAIGGLDWFLRHFGPLASRVSKSGILWIRFGIWIFFAALILSWIGRGSVKAFRQWRVLGCVWLALGVAVLSSVLWTQAHSSSSDKIFATRNFYGVLTVYEHRRDEPDGHHFLLQHGRITHGLQFVDPEMAHKPTTYYAESSGVGLAVRTLPPAGRRIGVVGLGTGSMAVYGRAGDYLRIYEINPQVRKLATTRFTYVNECPALVEIAMGDARLSMERERPEDFDLLVLDAFSSDAIPVHLLTEEAFELYLRHLKAGGIIAVHISNHYLDLEPVVANVAKHFGFKIALIDFEENEEEWWLYSSSWILLTRDSNILDLPQIRSSMSAVKTNSALPLWTDDFTSLFQILKK